jgi:hypothetical protein
VAISRKKILIRLVCISNWLFVRCTNHAIVLVYVRWLIALTGIPKSKTGTVRVTYRWGAFVQPLLQWKRNERYIYCVCVCSLRYPAWNAHEPYCHMQLAPLYNIFLGFLTNGTILEKKMLLTLKYVLISSKTFVLNNSCLKKNSARYDQTVGTRYFCHILMKLEFFRRIVVKSANIKFHKMLSQREKSPSMRTDGQTRRCW